MTLTVSCPVCSEPCSRESLVEAWRLILRHCHEEHPGFLPDWAARWPDDREPAVCSWCRGLIVRGQCYDADPTTFGLWLHRQCLVEGTADRARDRAAERGW